MKFTSGLLAGMLVTAAGCVAYGLLFPNAKEEMCHAAHKVTKDMEKDLENMM